MERDKVESGRLEAGRDPARTIDSAGGAERGTLTKTTTGQDKQIGQDEVP